MKRNKFTKFEETTIIINSGILLFLTLIFQAFIVLIFDFILIKYILSLNLFYTLLLAITEIILLFIFLLSRTKQIIKKLEKLGIKKEVKDGTNTIRTS